MTSRQDQTNASATAAESAGSGSHPSVCSRPVHLEMMPEVERLKQEYDRVFMMDGRRWAEVRNKLHEYLRAYRAYEKARYDYYHANS